MDMEVKMRRKTVITNNREIYEKFSLLNFSSEVVLRNVKSIQIERILENINRKEKVLDLEIVGDYFVVKKIGQINFNIYLK